MRVEEEEELKRPEDNDSVGKVEAPSSYDTDEALKRADVKAPGADTPEGRDRIADVIDDSVSTEAVGDGVPSPSPGTETDRVGNWLPRSLTSAVNTATGSGDCVAGWDARVEKWTRAPASSMILMTDTVWTTNTERAFSSPGSDSCCCWWWAVASSSGERMSRC